MSEYEKSYWNRRYSGQTGEPPTSGYGSYGDQLIRKLEWIGDVVDESEVTNIVEFGCGDFNFGRGVLALFPFSNYVGLDISDVVIERNKRIFKKFHFQDISEGFPHADIVMCVDVLFHIIDDKEAEVMLDRLEKAWKKYLIVTAYERDEEKENHVRIRKFYYSRFGEPIVRKIVEEDGELYFYIFKK